MRDDMIHDTIYILISIPFPIRYFYQMLDIGRKQTVGSLDYTKWDPVLELFP